MNWLFGTKARARKSQAAVAVEGLEGRELMAGFTNLNNLANTLNARDTIDIQRLNTLLGIQQLQLTNTAQLQQVIVTGATVTQGVAQQYNSLLAQEAAARFAGNSQAVFAIQQAEQQTLAYGKDVRSQMHRATVVSNNVNRSLAGNANQVNRTFANTQNNLQNGNNPFLTVPHAVNAFNVIGQRAELRAYYGNAQLNFFGNSILSPLQQAGII